MWLERLGHYVMQSRKHAVVIAAVFAWLPFFAWVSALVMALVTLRRGAKEGAIILIWVLLPCLSYPGMGLSWLYFFTDVSGNMALFLSAVVLRETGEWRVLLRIWAWVSATGVILFHLFIPNLTEWWYTVLAKTAEKVLKSYTGTMDLLVQNFVHSLSQVATGLEMGYILVFVSGNLMAARWIQALLYHKGGLRQELIQLRLGYADVFILILCVILVCFGMPLFKDILPVLVIPFAFAGINLIHVLANQWKKYSTFALMGLYGVSIFYLKYILLFFVLLAAMDACVPRWMDSLTHRTDKQVGFGRSK